ncbi:hypothetical protein B0O99DRAFT_599873 [Bisporella sp. PMI_857]|nr:hypothetical protein B0O99DRAFT_599873 [Bisporella sp. PMI_857]
MAEESLTPLPDLGEGTGATVTPASDPVSLADLCAKATSYFARRNYEAAADLYAQASELQAKLRGETDPQNADVLFLYGRSLFEVGKSKSDVLGGKSSEKKKAKDKTKNKTKKESVKDETIKETKDEIDKVAEEAAEAVDAVVEQAELKKDDPAKPLFQFTGDDNFEDSDEEEQEADDEDDEEDDLANAYEVLDLARVLFTRRLEQPETAEEIAKGAGDSAMTEHIKKTLADTHALQGEINLENENFSGAVTDFRSALSLKREIYPEEDEIIAEAHYFLSLALEFASIKPVPIEGSDEDAEPDTQVDQNIRDEAARETEAAIKSIKLKLQNKEVELASSANSEENDILRTQIGSQKEILQDMENRLADLSKPPVDVKGMKESVFGLGSNAGESATEAEARIAEVSKNANDLSGLIRKKKPAETATPTNGESSSTNGKRKAEDDAEDSESAKKVKVVTVEDVKEE